MVDPQRDGDRRDMTDQKKILYVRTDIYDQELIAGGSVSHTLGVIKGFLNLGYAIVYASSINIPAVEKVELSGIVHLKKPRMAKILRWKLNCLLSNIFFTYQLISLCKKNNFEFIYQRYSLLNCSGALVRWFANTPLILEYNGSEVWVNKHWVKDKWFKLSWLTDWIELVNIRYADTIVVVSQVLKDELIARHIDESKIVVNPNGVDTDEYDPAKLAPHRNKIRKELTIEERFVFGFIGTFSVWHGIEALGIMIPAIIKQRPHAHFLLIGDGPLKKALQDTIKHCSLENNVTFVGIKKGDEARYYLAACDAFLCPTQPNPDGSRFFGSPTKIFEYMSMGKPVIASDLEQLAEIIVPAARSQEPITQHRGFLVRPDDIHGFVAMACYVADLDNEQRITVGNNARAQILQHYQWIDHVRRIIAFKENADGLSKRVT